MKIVALAGGVGGAKLADGLARLLSPAELTIIVNTGDDFEHLGLSISPDLDTVCYTLAGMANPKTGWGRAGDSYQFMGELAALDMESWFNLGDKDLATHLVRTSGLRSGKTLSEITSDLCMRWGINHSVIPMSNEPIRTMIDTVDHGEIPFQEYFVHRRCEPVVRGFRFAGIGEAEPSPGVIEAITYADFVIFCPSNPWLSIDPILNVKDIGKAIARKTVLAVSPIIGRQAVKGPLAKIFTELGFEPSASAVASHYYQYLSGFIIDHTDLSQLESIRSNHLSVFISSIIMKTFSDRRRLAEDVLHFTQLL